MTPAATVAGLVLLTVAPTLLGAQPLGKSGWDEREAKVVEQLERAKWSDARKRVEKLLDDVQSNAWETPGATARMARLGRYLAVAEINLGMNRAAVWHWLSAWNLQAPHDLETIASYGRADLLLEYTLRPPGEMPPGFALPGDLELLRLVPAELNTIERPILANDMARRGGPVTDLQVELLIDRDGQLFHPVIHETGVQAIAIWATLDWILRFPPARPATLDGAPVDVLQTVTVTFGRDDKPGFVFQ